MITTVSTPLRQPSMIPLTWFCRVGFAGFATMVILVSQVWADTETAQFDPTRSIYDQSALLCVPSVQIPPRVDGKILDGEWDQTAAFTGFYHYETGNVLNNGPVAMLARSGGAIHVLVVTPIPVGHTLQANATERDGDVFRDDSIEFYLKPQSEGALFQFVVNSSGVVADYRNDDIAWNGEFEIRSGQIKASELPSAWYLTEERYWFAEFSIDAMQLGEASVEEAELWKLNLAVNQNGPWAVSAPLTQRAFNEYADFGEIRFVAPSSPFVRVTSLGELQHGDGHLRGALVNPGQSALQARAEFDLRKKDSRLTQDAYRNVIGVIHGLQEILEAPPNSTVPIALHRPGLETDVDQVGYRVVIPGETDEVLVNRHGPINVSPLLASTFLTVPSRQLAILKVDTSGLKDFVRETEIPLTVSIVDEEGKETLARDLMVPVGESEHSIETASLPDGRYRATLNALTSYRPVITEHEFDVRSHSVWSDSTLYDELGTRTTVPKPWTDVTYAKRKVSVWGRDYEWTKDSLLPGHISATGAELLCRPMRLVATINGQAQTVPLERFVFDKQASKRGTFHAIGQIQGLTVKADMWIEYDGFLWVDLNVEDNDANRRVDSLHVVVDMPSSSVPLYQTFDSRQAGYIGTEEKSMGWVGAGNVVNFYHWLGNEDRGLGFTYTSLEHWTPKSSDAFCTIEPGDDTTTYRVHLADQATQLNGRSYRFGIQATPIKPLRPDYHAMMGTTLELTPWKAWLKFPQNIDITTVWPHPNSKIMMTLNDPYQVDENMMRERVSQAHGKGVPLVSIAACPQKFTLMDESARRHQLEWQVLPESKLNWEGLPNFQNCANSKSLRKWLFHGWAIENVQKFGLDGIYYDGWQGGQIACSNPHHGCGWIDENGERQLTVPVLAGREYNQRIIQFLEENVDSDFVFPETAPGLTPFPRYQYWIHSWQFAPSVMGFATSWLTGEFTGWPREGLSTLDPKGTFGTSMGLGKMRVLGLSTNWGLPNLFLPLMWEHTEDMEIDRQTLMAYAWLLPHGAPIADLKYMNQKTVAEITDLFMKFRIRHAEFTPGWRDNQFLKITSPEERQVMVATWNHKNDDEVLAVVSNLTVGESRTVNLQWTGDSNVILTNARTGQTLSVMDGKLAVELPAESFVLVRATRK